MLLSLKSKRKEGNVIVNQELMILPKENGDTVLTMRIDNGISITSQLLLSPEDKKLLILKLEGKI